MYPLKKFLPSKTKYRLCNSLILPLLDYGDVVYHSSITVGLANSIQKLQNTCMRFSFNIPFRNHITPYLNEQSILNMTNRRKLHIFTQVYRVLDTNQPPYLKELFTINEHSHRTRSRGDFSIQQHKTTSFQKSFSFVAVQMWNSLSNDVKNFKLNKFKHHIKNMLLEAQKN